jgi:hypothetical protein
MIFIFPFYHLVVRYSKLPVDATRREKLRGRIWGYFIFTRSE